MSWVSTMVRRTLPGTFWNSEAKKVSMSQGEMRMPTTVKAATARVRRVKNRERKSRVSSSLPRRRYSASTGMKAAVMAPSATRRLKRFGMLVAKPKASEAAPVPR
jgi:hypothetical protein